MSELIKDKIADVLEKYYTSDLRNALMRDLIASEIAAEVDEDYDHPTQEKVVKAVKSEETTEKGIFEKYLESPDDEHDMNSGTDAPELGTPEEAIKAVREQQEMLKNKTRKVISKKPVERVMSSKPQMSDFFDKPEKVKGVRTAAKKPVKKPKKAMVKKAKKTQPKKTIVTQTKKTMTQPKKPVGLKNLGGKRP